MLILGRVGATVSVSDTANKGPTKNRWSISNARGFMAGLSVKIDQRIFEDGCRFEHRHHPGAGGIVLPSLPTAGRSGSGPPSLFDTFRWLISSP